MGTKSQVNKSIRRRFLISPLSISGIFTNYVPPTNLPLSLHLCILEYADIVDNNLHEECQEQVLKHVAKLTKLFSAYASERPFEFLIMHNAPTVISTFVQICQHEAPQFNKTANETDEMRLAVLGKIVIGGISTIRSLLRAVSDPKILEKGSFTASRISRMVVIVEKESRGEQVDAATTTIETIFNSANVLELAVLLLRHFLILRQCDLEAWEEDPEEWVLEVTGDVVSAESGFRVFNLNVRGVVLIVRLREKHCLWNLFQIIRTTCSNSSLDVFNLSNVLPSRISC